MTIDDIKTQLETSGRTFPEAALRAAMAQREAITPLRDETTTKRIHGPAPRRWLRFNPCRAEALRRREQHRATVGAHRTTPCDPPA